MGDLKAKARLKGLMGPHDGVGDIVSDAAEAGLVQGLYLSEPVYMHALANDELPEESFARVASAAERELEISLGVREKPKRKKS